MNKIEIYVRQLSTASTKLQYKLVEDRMKKDELSSLEINQIWKLAGDIVISKNRKEQLNGQA